MLLARQPSAVKNHDEIDPHPVKLPYLEQTQLHVAVREPIRIDLFLVVGLDETMEPT